MENEQDAPKKSRLRKRIEKFRRRRRKKVVNPETGSVTSMSDHSSMSEYSEVTESAESEKLLDKMQEPLLEKTADDPAEAEEDDVEALLLQPDDSSFKLAEATCAQQCNFILLLTVVSIIFIIGLYYLVRFAEKEITDITGDNSTNTAVFEISETSETTELFETAVM